VEQGHGGRAYGTPHAAPLGFPLATWLSTRTIDATDLILDFFAART
jgi:hypothetical protein